MDYKGKRALIVGVGKSGRAAARFLASRGADVIATDLKKADQLTEAARELDALDIYQEFGGYNRATFLKSELIVLSPGVDPSSALIRECVQKGVEIVNEPELAFRELRAPVVAVTGSNGKTTTTTLIGEILRASGRRPFVGGNIGVPLLEAVGRNFDVIVAELSSYQLELIQSLRPAAAIFTNISQNHLDRYKTMERYTAAKKRLRELCDEHSVVVLNGGDPVIASFAEGSAVREVRRFSSRDAQDWIHLSGTDKIAMPNDSFAVRSFQLPGVHNLENLMAAIAGVWNVGGVGANREGIETAIVDFKGVPHRIQFVREVHGVRYYNDSKSTTVQSLITALNGFADGVNVLLIGGRDKGSDYRALVPLLNQKCRAVIAFGEAAELIAGQLRADVSCVFETRVDLQTAFARATELAVESNNVLLSPACASQDQFTDFEHRGRVFVQLVESFACQS